MIELRLKEFLRERGITQRQLALITGLSRSTIGKYANNHTFPNDKNLNEIAHVLGIPVSKLLISDNTKEGKQTLVDDFTQLLDVHFLGPDISNKAIHNEGSEAGVYTIEYAGQVTIKPGSLVIFKTDLSGPISIDSNDVFGYSFEDLAREFELMYECECTRNKSEKVHWEVVQRRPLLSYNTHRSFSSLAEVFASIRASYMEYVSNRNSSHSKEIHSIEFSPEHKHAGVQILNYFQETLEQKYPDDEVTVRLSQEGTKVTMEIETLDGQKEKFEKAFEEYGLVITGQKKVEEYLDNPVDQLGLKFQLRHAHNQLETTRELLKMKDQVISSQKDSISYFQSELSQALSASRNQTGKALDIASQALASDKDIKKLVATFEAELKNGKEEQVKAQVASLKKEKPGFFKSVFEFVKSSGTKAGEKVLTGKLQEIIETVSDGSALPPA
ncbi:MAG: hypothetical protein Roseis2KO_00460 [Roseivirga sp.]